MYTQMAPSCSCVFVLSFVCLFRVFRVFGCAAIVNISVCVCVLCVCVCVHVCVCVYVIVIVCAYDLNQQLTR